MAAHDQIEVQPLEDGSWENRYRIDGDIEKVVGPFESRKLAIQNARDDNGITDLNVTDQAGNVVARMRTRKDDSLRIVLCRLDESEYGELDPPPSTATGQPHIVSLTPVKVFDTAQKLNDQEG